MFSELDGSGVGGGDASSNCTVQGVSNAAELRNRSAIAFGRDGQENFGNAEELLWVTGAISLCEYQSDDGSGFTEADGTGGAKSQRYRGRANC